MTSRKVNMGAIDNVINQMLEFLSSLEDRMKLSSVFLSLVHVVLLFYDKNGCFLDQLILLLLRTIRGPTFENHRPIKTKDAETYRYSGQHAYTSYSKILMLVPSLYTESVFSLVVQN